MYIGYQISVCLPGGWAAAHFGLSTVLQHFSTVYQGFFTVHPDDLKVISQIPRNKSEHFINNDQVQIVQKVDNAIQSSSHELTSSQPRVKSIFFYFVPKKISEYQENI